MSVQTIAVPYIPNPDHEALAWMEHFAAVLQPHPSAFGIDPRDVASLIALIRDFRERLAAVSAPAARMPGHPDAAPGSHGITEKTLARNAATLAVQRMVGLLKINPLVTEEDLKMLGL